MSKPEKHVLICSHSRPADDPKGSCIARNSQSIIDTFASEFGARELWGRFKVSTTSCLGACMYGPTVVIYPDGVMYQKVKESDVATIIDEHLLGGKPVKNLEAPADVW